MSAISCSDVYMCHYISVPTHINTHIQNKEINALKTVTQCNCDPNKTTKSDSKTAIACGLQSTKPHPMAEPAEMGLGEGGQWNAVGYCGCALLRNFSECYLLIISLMTAEYVEQDRVQYGFEHQ